MNYIEIIELPETQNMADSSMIPVAHAGQTCKLRFDSLKSLMALFQDVTYNKTTGKFTFTRTDNTTAELSTDLQLGIKGIAHKSGDYKKLVLTHNSGATEEIEVGTITGVQMNGTTVSSSGVANLGNIFASTELFNHHDLNNVTQPGFYFAAGSNTIPNKPTGIDAFGLLVYRSAGGYITQELTGGNNLPSKKFIRQQTSTWSAWTEMKYTDTDVRNTAGATDTSSKIFLVGATSQAASPQTYSDNEVYAQNGVLSEKSLLVNNKVSIEYNSQDESIDFKFV